MNIRIWTGVIFAWLALGTACGTITAPDDFESPEFVPRFASWPKIMSEVIGPNFEDVLVAQAGQPEPNFAAIFEAADDSAGHIALGYGTLARPKVKDFDRYAREAEAWYREIAGAASRFDREEVQRLVNLGESAHCDRCHDAANPW